MCLPLALTLDGGLRIVEANPGKFKLPAGDLQERKVFVDRMREAVQVRRVSG